MYLLPGVMVFIQSNYFDDVYPGSNIANMLLIHYFRYVNLFFLIFELRRFVTMTQLSLALKFFFRPVLNFTTER